MRLASLHYSRLLRIFDFVIYTVAPRQLQVNLYCSRLLRIFDFAIYFVIIELNEMKTLEIPFIPEIETLDFRNLAVKMETGAARSDIGTVCWPEEFPYKPDASFSIARSRTHLAILYRVTGLDLRAKAMEDNGPVWEDSCCEFFVGDPAGGTYCNFEMNCIGTLLAARRRSREDFERFPQDKIAQVIRHTSLERKEYDISDTLCSWQTAICIPFSLIGADPDNLPASLRANFYKCADKSAHPHFLSWNPVAVPHPDFHRPEFFGELYL